MTAEKKYSFDPGKEIMNFSMRWQQWSISLSLLGLLAGGCSEITNPYRDDLPLTAHVSTASANQIRQQTPTAASLRQRDWPVSVAGPQDQGTTHWPLWWEDSFEDKGSEDGQFAWTWEDYLALPYSPLRQLLNTAAAPVSALVDWPGTIRCSDGVISPQTFGFHNHDPVSCGGVASPTDILDTQTTPPTKTSSVSSQPAHSS